MQILPGDPNSDVGTTSTRVDNPYAPDDGEDPAGWIGRIALQWRGWLFHDTAGHLVKVVHDVREDRETGADITIAATLYASTAQAVAHGVNRHQVWEAMSRARWRKLPSNCISVGGKGLDGELLAVFIDEDRSSISDPTAANFVGEPVRPVRIDPKMAVNRQAQGIIARRYRKRLSRKDQTRDWITHRAPWDIGGAGVGVGDVVTLQYRGDYLIVSVDTTMLSAVSNVWETRFTGELLPLPI